MKSLKKRLTFIFLSTALLVITSALPSQSQQPSASDIMNMSNNRDQGNDFQSSVRLISADAQGNTAEMNIELVAKLIEGTKESGLPRYNVLATVSSPEDSEGLAVLVHEQDFPDQDDIWLFLPAIGSSKNIVPENFRTPLFGSEFTFEELIDREPALDSHELLREDSLDGRSVWVIQSTPSDPDIAGFAYRVTYVDQDSLLAIRMELYDDFETMIKLFTSGRIETIDGIPTRLVSISENLETGRSSTFEYLAPQYNQGDLADELFDPENLGN